MARGWWTLDTTIEPDDCTKEHIAEQIKQGYTSGEIIQEDTGDNDET